MARKRAAPFRLRFYGDDALRMLICVAIGFLLIGAIVSIVLCRIFLSEPITLRQVIAILILLVAVYIMCTYNVSLKGRMKLSELALLLLCGTSSGLADFSQKLFVKMRPEGSITAFNLYTYLFAGIVLFFACLCFRYADQKRGATLRPPLAVIKPIWIYVLVMAACLFGNSFFKTEAARYLDAVQLYPLSQGASVLVSVQLYPLSQGASVLVSLFLSAVFFKEKINGRCIVGIVLSFAALLLLNL